MPSIQPPTPGTPGIPLSPPSSYLHSVFLQGLLSKTLIVRSFLYWMLCCVAAGIPFWGWGCTFNILWWNITLSDTGYDIEYDARYAMIWCCVCYNIKDNPKVGPKIWKSLSSLLYHTSDMVYNIIERIYHMFPPNIHVIFICAISYKLYGIW